MNPDCPECKGTNLYIGLNVIEPCSICSKEKVTGGYTFEVPFDICNVAGTGFFYNYIIDTAAFFGQRNDQVQDFWESYIRNSLTFNSKTIPTGFHYQLSSFLYLIKELYYNGICFGVQFITEVDKDGNMSINCNRI